MKRLITDALDPLKDPRKDRVVSRTGSLEKSTVCGFCLAMRLKASKRQKPANNHSSLPSNKSVKSAFVIEISLQPVLVSLSSNGIPASS